MRLVLIGASGHGKVCVEIAALCGYDDILFLDDDRSLTECGGYAVVGVEADFKDYLDDKTLFFVSIGSAETRRRIIEKIEIAGGKIATLIHPKAVISDSVEVGIGSVVMAGAVINPGTQIGRGCIVNTSSSVDHDCIIGDYSHIAVGAHLCGTVDVGENSWIGAGAVVSNNLNICSDVTVGAGAVVIRDLDEAGTYLGVPAKRKVSKASNIKAPEAIRGGYYLSNISALQTVDKHSRRAA